MRFVYFSLTMLALFGAGCSRTTSPKTLPTTGISPVKPAQAPTKAPVIPAGAENIPKPL